MFNAFVFLLAITLMLCTGYNYLAERNIVKDIFNSVSNKIKCNSVKLSLPSGIEVEFEAQDIDRKIAWEIFVQIRTRIAAVDFRKNEDSLIRCNESLFTLFKSIREKIESLPVSRITSGNSAALVEFYISILNDGIRPFLTKWHIPVSHFHSTNGDSSLSELEVDKKFVEKNPEILVDMKKLNDRMKDISKVLLKIAQGENIDGQLIVNKSNVTKDEKIEPAPDQMSASDMQ